MSDHCVVLKFGGSSLATVERIRNVAVRVKVDYLDKGFNVAVVVSAMGKTTDGLVELAQKTSSVFNGREMASFCHGEQKAQFIAMAMEEQDKTQITLTAFRLVLSQRGHQPKEG